LTRPKEVVEDCARDRVIAAVNRGEFPADSTKTAQEVVSMSLVASRDTEELKSLFA
jgi:hypothetical protein